MKVLALSGSPRKRGNTAGALNVVLSEIEKAGIETELIHIGKEKILGCRSCFTCVMKQNEQCVIDDDPVNEVIQKMKQADGILLGSPVYFSGVSGTMKSFLDRAFFVISMNGSLLRHKVGASVVALRRSGGLPTLNSLNHFIQYSEMVMPSSQYWNVIHGMNPGEMDQDEEGKQILEVLGRNMAWLMKVMEEGKKSLPAPEPPMRTMTNFIR